MKPFRFVSLFTFALVSLASAQTASDPNEGSCMSMDTETGAIHFAWWGVADRTYFIQHTTELTTSWNYLPLIEQGSGVPLEYGFTVSGGPPRFFLRLRYTDEPATDPFRADFDADGIPNGWEIEHGLNPFDAADASAVIGGLTNLELYEASLGFGADPTTAKPLSLILHTP